MSTCSSTHQVGSNQRNVLSNLRWKSRRCCVDDGGLFRYVAGEALVDKIVQAVPITFYSSSLRAQARGRCSDCSLRRCRWRRGHRAYCIGWRYPTTRRDARLRVRSLLLRHSPRGRWPPSKKISVAWSSSRQFVPDIDPTCVVVVQVLQHILWFASTIRMISGWTVQRAHRALLCHL
jgi:hypothetical protein